MIVRVENPTISKKETTENQEIATVYPHIEELLSPKSNIQTIADTSPILKDLPVESSSSEDNDNDSQDLNHFLLLDQVIQDYMIRLKDYGTAQLSQRQEGHILALPKLLSHKEENILLKHFFEEVLPLLDANPAAPWAKLTLSYCKFDVAKNCFLCIASVHLQKRKNHQNQELYTKSVTYLSSIMEVFLKLIGPKNVAAGMKITSNDALNSFMILVLIYIFLIYTFIESGISSSARQCFLVFDNIVSGDELLVHMAENTSNEDLISLIAVLSWFDCIAAITSYDCRLPLCQDEWFGSDNSSFSLREIMGCPRQIFVILRAISEIRYKLRRNILTNNSISLRMSYDSLEARIVKYREYVIPGLEDDNYQCQLKCAQCWAIAAYVSLIRVISYNEVMIKPLINEFLDVYGTLDQNDRIVTQMIWPLFIVGCECQNNKERLTWLSYIDSLYNITLTGVVSSTKKIVTDIWETQQPVEACIMAFASENKDFLPV